MNINITTAIKKRCLLAFWYDGTQRIVEPHTYGIDGKGHEALSAYQVNIVGETGTRDWRLFHRDRMSAITVLGERFVGTRPGYVPGGGQLFSQVFATL